MRGYLTFVAMAAAGITPVYAQTTPMPLISTAPIMSSTTTTVVAGYTTLNGVTTVPAVAEGAPTRGIAPAVSTPPIMTGSDRDVSAWPGSYEGETAAAATPSRLVAGSNHVFPGGCLRSAATGAVGDCAPLAYATTDARTFTRTSLPRVFGGTRFLIGFDPALDVDGAGNFYYTYGVANITASALGEIPGANAVVAARSSDGINWTPLTPVTFNSDGSVFDDKYYLAVDRSPGPFAGRIYVSWDRNINASNTQKLFIAYSSNDGASWSAPIKVNDGNGVQRVIFAYPAVDPSSGTVYDSWEDYGVNAIFVDRSTDGGNTWGTDVRATTTHTGFARDIGCVGGRGQGPAHSLKVGPSGALYLVYADRIQQRGYDIELVKSTDGGRTWSTPLRLNDDSGKAHQYQPTLAVASNGAGGDLVTVSFYDRRDDPNNCASQVYATWSTDGGNTWAPNQRQTSAPSTFNGNVNGPGDYSTSTTFAGSVFPFFADKRAANPSTAAGGAFDVYTVNIAGTTPAR